MLFPSPPRAHTHTISLLPFQAVDFLRCCQNKNQSSLQTSEFIASLHPVVQSTSSFCLVFLPLAIKWHWQLSQGLDYASDSGSHSNAEDLLPLLPVTTAAAPVWAAGAWAQGLVSRTGRAVDITAAWDGLAASTQKAEAVPLTKMGADNISAINSCKACTWLEC